MSKSKSQIPTIIITISSCLTLILLVFLKSKFSTSTKPQSIYSTTNSPSPTFVPKTSSIPSPSPSPSPKNLKKETIRRENPDKTLAFYYSAEVPAFSQTGLTNSGQKNEDDPFKLAINGDTSYFTQKAANQGWRNNGNPLASESYTAIVMPMLVDLRSNSKHELKSVDKGMILGNGYTQVLRWVDNTHLLSRSCGEAVGCDFDLVNAKDDVLIPYASTNMYGYNSFNTKSRVKNYTFVQSCLNTTPCDIKIYRDLPIKTSNYFLFDLSTYSPINTFKVTKYLNTFNFDSDNITTLDQRAKFYLSTLSPYDQNSKTDGYFIFDLVTGTVMEQSNI